MGKEDYVKMVVLYRMEKHENKYVNKIAAGKLHFICILYRNLIEMIILETFSYHFMFILGAELD